MNSGTITTPSTMEFIVKLPKTRSGKIRAASAQGPGTRPGSG
ncbi:MAG: hypothetical protein R3A10_00750 [Caldilineaceae bacterium]